jgi:hypothetical protein
MNGRSHAWIRSLSRGAALLRWAAGLACLAVILALVLSLFPSREEKLWQFVDERRDALIERREDDLFAGIGTSVRYQDVQGLAEMRRDYGRWRAAGIGTATILEQEATLDPEGADVRLRVALLVGIRPVADVRVTMRLDEDEEGAWRIVSLSWK